MTDESGLDPNKHILDYLRYYCDQGGDFDYAVLLNGPWGVGKTFLIKKFVATRTDAAPDATTKTRTLYVSLYGVTSVRQIEDEYQRQLHPILSSRGIKIAGTVAKGLLKLTTKIDFGDKEEVSLNAQIPDIDLTAYLPTPKDCILVFDDLERCSMNVSDVLGYINSFVEHHGFKAIILANEAVILENEDTKYAQIKEKMIGQTLEVRSSTSAALPNFLRLIHHEKTREFLSKHADTILSHHQQSGTGNLRLLKHALWDFERLSTSFAANHWSNEDALIVLLRIVLALSFEVRSGFLKADDFTNLGVSEIERHMAANRGEDASTAGRFEKKYAAVTLQETPLGFEHLKVLLFEGWLDPEEVRVVLNGSRYYSDPALEPPWLTAWRGWEVEDDRFDEAVNKVEDQFKLRNFQSTEEMLHIFGLRLFFAEIGAINFNKDQVVAQCIECLDELARDDKIQEFDASRVWRAGGVFCFGHQVTQSESTEFKAIYDAFDKKIMDAKAAHLPHRGKELLLQLTEDTMGYARKVCLNNVSASEYYNVPILATIPPKDFVNAVLGLGSSAQGTVFAAFKGRYELGLLSKELASEAGWLKKVRAEFASRIPSLKAISRFRLTNLVGRNIDPFIHSLSSPAN
jgi:hypothetical protein